MTEKIYYTDWKDAPAILTAEEAATFLRVHLNTVKKLLADGKLPGKKIGRQWRINKEDLRKFMESKDK